MKKVSILGIMVLSFCFIFTLNTAALTLSDLTTMVIPDWELERIQPLEPGSLDKGEYRITTNFGRMGIENNYLYDRNDNYEDTDNAINVYHLGLDTALEKDLFLNFGYYYVPEYETESSFLSSKDKYKSNNLTLRLTKFTKNDNKLYFGYMRSNDREKDYNSSGILNTTEESISNFFYVGAQFYGSFSDWFKK